jgi:hypothetical protein
MPYHYENPKDARKLHKLPNIWIDYFTEEELREACPEMEHSEGGYMYCFCFPGCLPDSDWFGPFDSEEAALKNARQLHGD